MQQRLYIDTSVFGGFFDEEFAEFTQPLFKRFHSGELKLLFSAATQEELNLAPERVKLLVNNIKIENTEFVEISDEAVELATKYIEEKVVGLTSFADCLHIALATINRADYLVSWNFKHIVNVFRIRGYNSVNLKNGYMQLDIRSPKEIVYNEDEN